MNRMHNDQVLLLNVKHVLDIWHFSLFKWSFFFVLTLMLFFSFPFVKGYFLFVEMKKMHKYMTKERNKGTNCTCSLIRFWDTFFSRQYICCTSTLYYVYCCTFFPPLSHTIFILWCTMHLFGIQRQPVSHTLPI